MKLLIPLLLFTCSILACSCGNIGTNGSALLRAAQECSDTCFNDVDNFYFFGHDGSTVCVCNNPGSSWQETGEIE
jgi:hypothetical protein